MSCRKSNTHLYTVGHLKLHFYIKKTVFFPFLGEMMTTTGNTKKLYSEDTKHQCYLKLWKTLDNIYNYNVVQSIKAWFSFHQQVQCTVDTKKGHLIYEMVEQQSHNKDHLQCHCRNMWRQKCASKTGITADANWRRQRWAKSDRFPQRNQAAFGIFRFMPALHSQGCWCRW